MHIAIDKGIEKDYIIATMFIHRNTKKVGNKVYHSTLLMHNYWDNGKVKHKVILNLSQWLPDQIEALSAALKGKKVFSLDELKTEEGKSIGALWVFNELAKRSGIKKVLGNSRKGKLSLLMIMGRLLTQGSRLYLCEWGKEQALKQVIGIDKYDEDDLYEALDWLSSNQREMEKKLYKIGYKKKAIRLFLYDVTSSYFEGQCNEMAAYGYNRDGKRGKKQIVIGLLTQEEGDPISIEVFKGNSSDMTTVASQVNKLVSEFGVKEVVFIGDRGMIKSEQAENLTEAGYYYITAITKPEIELLLRQGNLQMGLFDEKVMEISIDDVRYIMRRNPVRVEEIKNNRQQKFEKLCRTAVALSEKLAMHSRAKTETAMKQINELAKKLRISEWTNIVMENRKINIFTDEEKLKAISKLDGCYVIKTNVSKKQLSTNKVHDRYKDLSLIEQAFKSIKTGFLEVRPIYVRKASRTKGHLFVTMLAYKLVRLFWQNTQHLGKELHHMIDAIDNIKTVHISLANNTVTRIPDISEEKRHIFKALNITLPSTLG